ncbi:MAG: hypothetical protein JW734_00325 [Candidatus Omnitrophica bacterium]|nr:hypothetical protein [Candidatus Omnitrophota bacterium]
MDFLRTVFFTDISLFMGISSLLVVAILTFLYLKKIDEIKEREDKIRKLEDNLEEMDEQARLIVKTDLELSQTQEELDRKITSLLALQRLSQDLSSSLEEEKIFSHIRPEIISELGFELCLVVLKEKGSLVAKTSIGLDNKESLNVLLGLMKQKDFLDLLIKERILYPNNLSSSFEQVRKHLKEEIKLKSFIVSVIQTKEGVLGVVILGSFSEEEIFKGVRETIEILSTQISQAIENIALFEQLYNSQQELEVKINERTRDLQRALEEISKINQLKSQFVSAVSHELRTPLTSIKGYASLLVQEKFGKLPSDIKVRLERINQQSDSLVSMINDLLDIARIESGRMKIDIQKVDIVELAKRVGDLLFPQMQEKNIHLKLECPESLAIDADKKLIERVLINLLNNAVKFTPQDKAITIAVGEEKDYVKVSVKDEGIGISQEDLGNVFREFYKVDNPVNKELKGTGLGLSLAKNIVKAHKGDIWAESALGEGANFIFTLPR